MSNNLEHSSHASFSEEVSVPSPEIEQVPSPQVPFHLTAESELLDEKLDDMKTSESQDNDSIEDEQANTKRSRELKLLLALSKEANLDINISHKRKSLDTLKLKELASPLSKLANENESAVKKPKIDKFPVTAESEIEITTGEGNSTMDMSTADKTKKDDGAMGEDRKNLSKDIKIFKPNKDMYCWRCHREGVNISCETCPRSYHQKCLKQTIADEDNWPCPECVTILKAESTQTRSTAMRGMTLEHLCSLLKFAVKRMIQCNGSEPFHQPVNDKLFPDYKKYIIQPMNLKLLEKNIKENLYGSTHAFEADAKWILHNSIIFNSYQSKLTTNAKGIMKICKQEMAEIENCPSCYLNANTKKSTWFVEVCPKPHILVWAKLKGFPYWPAKAMCTNNSGMVDVRFFGAHDRAWVPSKECFLYSRRDPNSNKQKRNDIIECMREVEVYIANIKALYGEFNYAPFKMQYDPEDELKQLLLFIPRYKPNAPPPKKRMKSLEPKAKTKNDLKEENENVEENTEVIAGYGTDDDMIEGEALDTSKINQSSQKDESNVDKEESNFSDSQDDEEGEDNMEPEIDDDTQLSSNVLDVPRGSIRTRGGLNASPGKLKTLPRRISEECNSKKRLASEEHSPPSKIARRNSDQSIKSDSSRLSSLSDRINRVDMSENVELTLGNTSDSYITSSTVDLETRKKPVQVEVSNIELSISPQSKANIVDRPQVKTNILDKQQSQANIADRLMEKLSSSDEDISQSKEDKKESDEKLETDIILEKYKDLVKKKSMEFSNVEASTSFGITSVVSKEVCVSSDEGSSKNSVDDAVHPKKLDILNEELSEDNRNDNSEADISSTENIRNEVEIENIIETEKVPEHQIPVFKELDKNQFMKDISEGENSSNEVNESAAYKIVEEDKEMDEENEISSEEESKKGDESAKDNTSEKSTQDISEGDNANDTENISPEKEKSKDNICRKDTEEAHTEVSTVETNAQTIKEANATNVSQAKSTTIATDKTDSVNTTQSNAKVDDVEQEKIGNKIEVTEFAEISRLEGKKIITYSRKDRKSTEMKRKESPVIEQPTDSNSSDDQGLVLDDTQIDETNIRNIIHSSLNNIAQNGAKTTISKEGKLKRKPSNTTLDETSNKKIRIDKEKVNTKKESSFKIVPIQHILDKNIDEDSPERPVTSNNSILLKKLSQPRGLATETSSDIQPLECVEIKSEPDSEDDLDESQYMEAKRKYMSALNISERTEEVVIPKKNEIRTRSKTEEIGKGKQMDNLSRVIEEVATTFSAKHETQKKIEKKQNTLPVVSSNSSVERRKAPSQENGEIFVKSFAKISQQPHQQARVSHKAQPIQKSKPTTSANKGSSIQTVRREVPSKQNVIEPIPQTTLTKTTTANASNTMNTPSTATNKTLESLSTSGNVLILTQPGVILPTSQQLAYNAGGFVTFVPSQQNMAMMQTPQVINAVMTPSIQQNENVPSPRANLELNRSQNYIPQNEELQDNTNRTVNPPPPLIMSNGTTVNHMQNRDIPSLIPIIDNDRNTNTSTGNNANEGRAESTDDEFSLLHSMVPESVSKAISEVLCRPPPKLKPRPPGPLSQVFDSGNPSTAGPVSAKINSISHRLGDYFRGMLVEMLEDLGKVNNSEATIASLKHEIETLQQKHASEMMDIRKNVCTILKDIQGSILEERERLVDETRSACEIEALRRIEEAKSKQWCANCGKEAQFYCCWNTSYCDYSCQIKQWSKHMSKCTQNAGQSQPAQSPAIRPQSQLTFRPTGAKAFSGRLVAKPTKVYLNRSTNSKTIPGFKSTPGGHLTLVDSSNFEFLTNAPGTKFIATSSLLTRVRNVTSTVTSPSNGSQQTDSPSQRVRMPAPSVRPSPSTSNVISSMVSDEEMDSD